MWKGVTSCGADPSSTSSSDLDINPALCFAFPQLNILPRICDVVWATLGTFLQNFHVAIVAFRYPNNSKHRLQRIVPEQSHVLVLGSIWR